MYFYRLDVITPQFGGKSQIARHRLVNGLLKDEMAPGLVHALQLHTRTPEEDEKFQEREREKVKVKSATRGEI